MESLHICFERLGQCITIIGSGGKTSLIQYLAQKYRQLKTLVTTTTRMGLPSPKTRGYDYFLNYKGSFQPPYPGISLGGIIQEGYDILKALPEDVLAEIVPWFDQVFIEGDGSRTLPLKAWADYEPVVPPYTTATVGILPLWPLGMPVSPAIIHRLPLFTALTGAQQEESLTFHHLVLAISSNTPKQGKGLFSAAQGKRILFFNQVERDATLANAQKLVSLLPQSFLSSLHRIIAGSVQQERGLVLWESSR